MATDIRGALDALCRDPWVPEDLQEKIAIKLEQGAGPEVLAELYREALEYIADAT